MDVPGDLAKALPNQRSTHGDTPGNALGDRHQVGTQVEVLACKKLARAPDAGLDLVDDEERAVLVAERLGAGEELLGAGIDPAFALNDLDDHGGSPTVLPGILHRCGHALELVVGNKAHIGDERLERLAVLLAPRRRQRPHAAPVKPAHRGDSPGAARGEAGELERGLNGLGPRVAQESAVQPRRRDAYQLGKTLRAHVVVETVGRQKETVGLGTHRGDDGGMGVAHGRRTVPADAVNVLGAVHVPDAGALPPR